jgi:single-strand DNA-binding protein
MFETPITIVGNIVTKPDRKRVGDQELIKFRVASNSRRRTADGNWEPGNSLFVTVNCWGRLVTGVGAALGKGDPVVVVGYVYTSEYDDKDGNRRPGASLASRAADNPASPATMRRSRPSLTPTTRPMIPKIRRSAGRRCLCPHSRLR